MKKLQGMKPAAEHLTGQHIVEIARGFLGVPFRHQGRTVYGVDCIGLVILTRHTAEDWPRGIRHPADYRRNPQAALVEALADYLEPLTVPEPGCVALMAWPKQRHASHVGILTPATLIHSYAAAGFVVETGYRGQWLAWTRALYRLPGVDPWLDVQP